MYCIFPNAKHINCKIDKSMKLLSLLKLRDLGLVADGIIGQLSSLTDSLCELLKDLNGAIPVNASISDRDTLLEACWTLLWNLLITLVNVGLDHDTDNRALTSAELVTNDLGNLWLIAVVLVGVSYFLISQNFSKQEFVSAYRESSQS